MRATLTACMAVLLSWQAGCQSTATAATRRDIDLSYIEELASGLAARPYEPEQGKVPEILSQLDYDAFRDIRFDPQQALWAAEELPFRVEFFHPGYTFTRSVRINEFTDTHEQEVRFNTGFFNYGRNGDLARRLPTSMGYAGFRVRYPLNRSEVFDEVIVFLGASYFRAVGRGQSYGLSARGLAINTGLATPEEFPRFREFWLGKPEPGDETLTFYALLDSESVTGAYNFVLRPGAETELDVTATLFMRKPVERLGLAPFSSMFFFGENTLDKPPDFRPEVHDSDGVTILAQDGTALWRPLINPSGVRTSIFAPPTPAGWGLIQRDRDYEHYQDIEAAYHLRPSAWVTPTDMPDGSVTLFEFNTPDETNDNVALLFAPTEQPQPGTPLGLAYTIAFGTAERSPSGLVVATRIGCPFYKPGVYEFIVDFYSERLAGIAEVEQIKTDLSVSGGAQLSEPPIVQKNPFNNTWRLIAYVTPQSTDPVEFNGRLLLNGEPLTETWSYQWIPPPTKD